MMSLSYQPHQRRSGVRLGWEAGRRRRQETSTYQDHLKVKETWFPRKRVLSNPSSPTTENWRRPSLQRPRRKTITNIIQVPTEDIEMKTFRVMKNDEEVQTDRVLPEELLLPPESLKKMTCGLRPPEATSSESVPPILNKSESPAHNFYSRSSLPLVDAPAIMFEVPQYSSTEIIQHGSADKGPNFHSKQSNDSAFWEEWSNVANRRTNILSLRSRTHEMRRILREKQNIKSVAEDKLMQRVLQQELALRSTPKSKSKSKQTTPPLESIMTLIQDCQDTRDDFGPFEEQCTSLEDELYRDEFILQRLEEQLYLRWNVVPSLRGDFTADYQHPHQIQHQPSPIPSIDYQEQRHDYVKIKHHPMVEQYLSKKGELETLNEQLYEFEERLYELEEDRVAGERYGRSLHPDDNKFLEDAPMARDIIMGRIQNAKEELEEFRGVCYSMKLIDIYGEPASMDSEDWKIAETDEDLSSNSEVLDYSKFSILITQPENPYPEAKNEAINVVSDIEKLPQPTSLISPRQVEFWMLMIVQCSAIDVNHLARWAKWEGITISDVWQQAVLEFWFKDGYSKSLPLHRPRTASLETQAPPQLENLDSQPSRGSEFPLMKVNSHSRYLRPFATDSGIITEV